MHYTLFPKFFRELGDSELMEVCAECGLDSPTALIREGFPLSPETLHSRLPKFTWAARSAGMAVQMACVDWTGDDLITHIDELKILSDNGITTIRAGLCFRDIPARNLAARARLQAESACKAAEKANLRLLIQLHHFAYPHNATAAYAMLNDLDPKYIGVMVDSGNNTYEGDEHPDYQAGLLGDFIGAFGAKDAAFFRDGDGSTPSKGWCCRFVPVFAGRTDWSIFYRAMRGRELFAVLMPFYEMGKKEFQKTLAKEVRYLRAMEQQTKEQKNGEIK